MLRESDPILEVSGLTKVFAPKAGYVQRVLGKCGVERKDVSALAVDAATFQIRRGDVVGVVGESGCGKSTLGRMVAGVLEPTAGEVRYEGDNLYQRCSKRKRLGVQLIFQDPFASLNPRLTVRSIIGEAARYHRLVSSADYDSYIESLMEQVGLSASYKGRYPHQFSGGQRQRVGIARALSVRPNLLVCDEAVSALDVSIQAQILNLFLELRERLELTYLFISHDLAVINYVSDHLLVMYLGRVVECGEAPEILAKPNHPYTKALLADLPRIGQRRRKFNPINGDIPSPLSPPAGCHFHPRCPHAKPICKELAPPLREVAPGRYSACHLNAGG